MTSPPKSISPQISYEESQECTTRLRRIVLYSADVLPHEVATYLKVVAKRGSWATKKSLLQVYRPLVDSLPKEYVDFVLSILIKKPRKHPHPSPYSVLREEAHARFGIEDYGEFLPPSHIKGPFLALLFQHEDEGLRLIHTLVNTAVARWRALVQGPLYRDTGLTPLPVVIPLPSGSHAFWGDQQVYYWYRPHSNGSYVVTSALMALECWMEQQIAAGREVEGLFDKVLSGSECVAVVGLCLGIALAYPEKCLKAALPIVSSPAVWLMDVERAGADTMPSFDWDPFGHDKHILALNAERDKQPQRSRDVRDLALYYMLSNENLRMPFEQAVSRFVEDLPFLYTEQRTDPEAVNSLRERMENLQSYGVRENYRQQRVNDKVQIWVELPDHIKMRNDAKRALLTEKQRWSTVNMWAQKTIGAKDDKGRAGCGMDDA